jgi:2-polyprenyl-3-methyl-5-hydroxy-6-metoxy-1,4-benzoquinol methylase
MNYYSEKANIYFTRPRKDLINFLPEGTGLKILEVGAGGGDTLIELKQSGKASEVAGIELFSLSDTYQNSKLIDRFIIGNIEEINPDLNTNHYDAILFGDVLEHLIDPWSAIKKLSDFLKPGGLLIASIPNIRSRQAFKKIFLKGDFGYTSEGLFDKTHFRWFCKKNMIDLLTPASFELVSVTSNLELKKGSGTRILNQMTGRFFEEFLTVQFITVSKKTN